MTELNEILKGVSRSFYLSLRFLPRRVRPSMGLAFLVCKAADTITDTRLLPRERRLDYLKQYRELFETLDSAFFEAIQRDVADKAENEYEKQLLLKLPQLFDALKQLPTSGQKLISALAQELTLGMIQDLTRFAGDSADKLEALNTESELDEYTYYVAGCVGVFWTRILREHFHFARSWNRRDMKEWGESFGKGLQLVNILRDLPRDLQQGRCYLPSESLQARGLMPHHLLDKSALPHVKPYLLHLVERTREKLHCARPYANAHPAYALRLKWVVLLPMQLGFQTLDRLVKSDDWLDPKTVIKVPRRRVYGTMLTSFLRSFYPGTTALLDSPVRP